MLSFHADGSLDRVNESGSRLRTMGREFHGRPKWLCAGGWGRFWSCASKFWNGRPRIDCVTRASTESGTTRMLAMWCGNESLLDSNDMEVLLPNPRYRGDPLAPPCPCRPFALAHT